MLDRHRIFGTCDDEVRPRSWYRNTACLCNSWCKRENQATIWSSTIVQVHNHLVNQHVTNRRRQDDSGTYLSEDIPLGLPLGLAKIPSQARSQPSDKWGRFSQILDLFQGLKIGVPSGGPSSLYRMWQPTSVTPRPLLAVPNVTAHISDALRCKY